MKVDLNKADIHIHTDYSDGFHDPETVINYAVTQTDLRVIAITDHNMFSDYELEKLENKYKIWIIPGVEIYTSIGDILALFVNNNVTLKDGGEVIDMIHTQNGLAILAHPFKRIKEYSLNIIKKLDAVEQINSRWVDLNNYSSDKKVNELLTSVRGRTAGSDSHFLPEIGNAYFETPLLKDKSELRNVISDGSVNLVCIKTTVWNDLASQFIKFIKNPESRQAVRLAYYLFRQVLKCKTRRRII